MMYDTDILIWIQRGNQKAARLVEKDQERSLSIQSYMELLQGARDKAEQKVVKDFIYAFDFQILPLSENIGHRALVYVEEYALAAGMRSADALIAATAVERNLVLVSSNTKHFKAVAELRLKAFRP
jgi:predicted nucleic acid-binding protein